ncbi:MAG TPA: response regulator [Burkholderiaceae bacterium]|nr:response regulator [Burkholderiaceae bacterium]
MQTLGSAASQAQGASANADDRASAPVAFPTTQIAAPLANIAAPASAGSALVRVRADLLERVVNESGEVSIARSRLDNELSQLRQALQELTENVGRLRTQLREIEIQSESQVQARIAHQRDNEADFDPLEFDRYTRFQELTRMLAESVNDVATVQQNAMRSLDGAAQDMIRQGQVLRELQQNLMRMRMVQFGTISDRLYRVVRQAAKELGKRVSMDMRGTSVELDRGVLERMAAPIEHLLRNAVAHGIEPPAARSAAGKAEAGEIRLELRQEGNEVVLVFADDGAGLDTARIVARARRNGLIAGDAAISDREAAALIFMPGFSTADSIDEISGRGVGLDVVRAEVEALGGRIDTDWTAGGGTRFTVHLPLTLAIAQVVLVSAGTQRYAIPASSVEQVLQLKPPQLAEAYTHGRVVWQGSELPIRFLGTIVGLQEAKPVAQHRSPVVVIRSGNQRIAVHADAVSPTQEVVVKNVGPQVARVPGVGGATVLGNGEIVLILNAVRLAQSMFGDDGLARGTPSDTIAALADVPPTVMVVDDSLTVRKVTQRLLAREGYDVMLAKDGVDALRQLQDRRPDLMLVDIEMPRMDGFDLTRNLRGDERYRGIPIVMITSRTADKHRNFAMSLGVDVFLGKPYRDDELLQHVTAFTRERVTAG